MNEKWHVRFLSLAKLVGSWSKDPSTQVGAVIVRPDKTIASVGFNGFPRYMSDNVVHYQNREEKYSRIIHAEVNALLHCNESVLNYTLYTYPLLPCDRCMVQVIQAGIRTCIAPVMTEEAKQRWGESIAKSKKYADECTVKIIEIEDVL